MPGGVSVTATSSTCMHVTSSSMRSLCAEVSLLLQSVRKLLHCPVTLKNLEDIFCCHLGSCVSLQGHNGGVHVVRQQNPASLEVVLSSTAVQGCESICQTQFHN